jgi:hypothetical protein
LTNQARVEFVVWTDESHFSGPTLAMDLKSAVTFSAPFVWRVEAASLFG